MSSSRGTLILRGAVSPPGVEPQSVGGGSDISLSFCITQGCTEMDTQFIVAVNISWEEVIGKNHLKMLLRETTMTELTDTEVE